MTDWPAVATSRSPSSVTTRVTVLVLPEGSTRTASPGLTVPLAMSPEKPRKSRFGRFTHCTGMRNGRAASAAVLTSTVSRCPIKVGPEYHGVFALGDVMLSPLKPEIGSAVNASIPMLAANAA